MFLNIAQSSIALTDSRASLERSMPTLASHLRSYILPAYYDASSTGIGFLPTFRYPGFSTGYCRRSPIPNGFSMDRISILKAQSVLCAISSLHSIVHLSTNLSSSSITSHLSLFVCTPGLHELLLKTAVDHFHVLYLFIN